jgi:glycosyltransferase involved in cell wall biosynthesis
MAGELHVVIDGIIYRMQSRGGISRIFNEILPRMCDIDNSLRIKLLTQGQLRQRLPVHKRISHHPVPAFERYLRPNRLWQSVLPAINRLMYNLWTGKGKGKIWHSTFYTVPAKWDGHLIMSVYDMIHERYPDLYSGANSDKFREIKRHSITRSDAVICISETTRQDVHHFYGIDLDLIYVVHLACSNVFIKLVSPQSVPNTLVNQPFLLYLGGRSHYKNFALLAKAFSIWPHRKDVTLVLVGGRPWSDDEDDRLLKLGIRDRVQLLTNVDDQTLCQLYNQALGFVYPSLYEGFGIPLLEAMACGCPVVASRIPSTVEVAGDCPIYFDPTEEDDLINALDILLSDGQNPERIEVGIKKAGTYSWDKTAAEVLKVYQHLA